MRSVASLAALVLALIMPGPLRGQQKKVTIVGLSPQAVETRLGKPDAKDELADSDEVYWTYKTPHGELTVHFQNGLVVSYSPEDFPLEKIVK